MNPSTERMLGIVIVAGMAGLWAYNSWISQPEKRRQRHAINQAESSQRFQQWAYIAKEKEVAPGETVKLVIIPHPVSDMLDTKCLIYTHRELKTSSMICPDATKEFIEERE